MAHEAMSSVTRPSPPGPEMQAALRAIVDSAAPSSDDAAARLAYAAPVDNQLFFAGEATDLEEFGTAHAALLSGEQAAKTIFEGATGCVAQTAHLPYSFLKG